MSYSRKSLLTTFKFFLALKGRMMRVIVAMKRIAMEI